MDAVPFMCQINRFVARNPDHPLVIEYNRGNIGLGYIVRHWQEITNEDFPNQWQGQVGQDNGSEDYSQGSI